jgi:hypothetical protein
MDGDRGQGHRGVLGAFWGLCSPAEVVSKRNTHESIDADAEGLGLVSHSQIESFRHTDKDRHDEMIST